MRPVLLVCVLLAACLNPMPEEFPSEMGASDSVDPPGNAAGPTSGSAGSGGSSGLAFGGAGGTGAESPSSPNSPELPPSDNQQGGERSDAGVDGGSASDTVSSDGGGGSEP